MTKKMRELQASILQKSKEAKGYLDGETKDIDKATAIMDEIDTTFAREQKAQNPRISKYTKKYHR